MKQVCIGCNKQCISTAIDTIIKNWNQDGFECVNAEYIYEDDYTVYFILTFESYVIKVPELKVEDLKM